MRYDPNLTRPKKPAIRVKRQPIIAQDLFNEMDFTELGNQPLANINGPSVIRVPNWVTHRFGKYYLYFAHHKGTSIRLAYADQITGPWRMHKKPVLSLEHSLFVSKDLDPETRRDWVNGPDYLYALVASPDVHVDHQNKQIVMFFHGLMPDGDQQSRLSTSSNGLSFTAAPLHHPIILSAAASLALMKSCAR